MLNTFFFAHGEDLHSADTSSLVHYLTESYIALPLYVGVGALLYVLLSTYKKGMLLPVMLTYNFVLGVLFYSATPIVSIIAITLGIIVALIVALGSIAGGN